MTLAYFAIFLLAIGLAQGRFSYSQEDKYGPKEEGCRAARLCCQGQNKTCAAAGPRLNDPYGTTCFCDEVCMIIGDCCRDYKQSCSEVDCVISDRYTDWSPCDKRCGWGMQVRTKPILVQPMNGGKRCPENVERRQCQGTNCIVARASEGYDIQKETAEIVPASFATWRENVLYSPFADIRRNLFEEQNQYAELRKDRERPTYCARFKITEARRSCQDSVKPSQQAGADDEWIRRLVRGTQVCVECQTGAMHKKLGYRCYGHGVREKETNWKAVTVPRCHGSWVMTSDHMTPCKCDAKREVSFVFV